MTRLVILLMLVATSAATQPAGDSVTLRLRGPRVGETWVEATELTVMSTPHGPALFATRAEHKTIEVLAVNGNAVVKAKVTYTQFVDKAMQGGAIISKPGPVPHKSYTLTSGMPTKIEADTLVSDVEADAIRDRDRHFGRDDRMAKALNGRTFPVGKNVVVPPVGLGGLPEEEFGKLTKWTLAFRGMVGTDAMFDTTLRLEDARNASTTELTGTIRIDPKTMATRLDVDGIITATGALKPDGKMSLRWRVMP